MNSINRYDDKYQIRLANKADIKDIMDFIECNWKSGHILGKNRSFFEYEFLENDETLNFIIAINKETKCLEGIFGFIPSATSKENRDLWGSIWYVKPGNMMLLGVELFKRLEILVQCRYHLGIGANPNTTIPIVEKYLNRKIGRMKHYYILSNDSIENFKVAKINYLPQKNNIVMKKNISVISIENREIIKSYFKNNADRIQIPNKDFNFINKKYFNHPTYKYQVFGIKNDNEIKALLICRTQECNSKKIYRIIDYIGDRKFLSYLGNFFEELMLKNSYEYIDFYCYGFEDEYLKNAGFMDVIEGDKNIIPNYFYPFIQKNIDIWVHSPIENVLYCKGDGDQDRPN